VIPEMRRKGIGTSLMLKAMEALRKYYSVDEYYLEVRVSNTPAINLYKKLGFTPVKVIKGYYLDGEDAYLMARPALEKP
ncbi:MAG: N-acetyltransferase, partial [Thermofilaceae archaeon]